MRIVMARPFLLLVMLLLGVGAFVVTAPTAATEQRPEAADENAARIIARLQAVRPDLPILRVSQAQIEGFYAVELGGGGMLYATADGQHLFAGDLFRLDDDALTNLADEQRSAQRAELIAGVRPEEMVVFAPADGTRAVINVFTDIDCGYCRQLHEDVPRLNELGIEVRYLGYPRSGLGTPSYDKLVTAWCSDDQQDAMTRLKAGETLPKRTCDNPVAEHFTLGGHVGVAGTPSIIMADGRMIPGYVQPEEMAARVGLTR